MTEQLNDHAAPSNGTEVRFKHEQFKRLRMTNGFTQTSIAEKIGVDSSTVSRWETGTIKPLPGHVQALCKVLGITPEDVYQ